MSLEQHEGAVSFLRATLKEVSDEELQILLADAERHVEEISRRAGEVVDTAERLLQADRVAEAVRFLDAQPESFAHSSRFREILGRAHECQERLHHISAAVEQAQAALSSRNWKAAEQAIIRNSPASPHKSRPGYAKHLPRR
jgi:CO dehydrogenase nickel-insertion accessory protein CooC1